jgi:acetyl-CoA acetyltransferase family protein
MSNIPLLFNKKMTAFFADLFKAKTVAQKLAVVLRFRPSFLNPVIAVQLGLTDPTCGLIMGLTAENIAGDFSISRQEQDIFALKSHNLAEQAQKNNVYKNEIMSICYDKKNAKFCENDDGVRYSQSIESLSKLKPFFLKPHGTVTVGNSSQITDGACGMILMSEQKAKQMGLKPLGYISNFSNQGCDQTRMGLGPVFAIRDLLKKTSKKLSDIDLFEINEAFSAQVIGCVKAMDSKNFFEKHFNEQPLGLIEDSKLNINGGAISIGHPVGASGARIILHSLLQLIAKNKQTAIASLCIGGGQGSAVLVERE